MSEVHPGYCMDYPCGFCGLEAGRCCVHCLESREMEELAE